MTSPFRCAGRFRQWLGAVQAAKVRGRASSPPAVSILRPLSTNLLRPATTLALVTDPDLEAEAATAEQFATSSERHVGPVLSRRATADRLAEELVEVRRIVAAADALTH
jgi:hypothetical protein